MSSVVDRDELEGGFRRLSFDHRAVVVLHHYLDLPIDRAADLRLAYGSRAERHALGGPGW